MTDHIFFQNRGLLVSAWEFRSWLHPFATFQSPPYRHAKYYFDIDIIGHGPTLMCCSVIAHQRQQVE